MRVQILVEFLTEILSNALLYAYGNKITNFWVFFYYITVYIKCICSTTRSPIIGQCP